MHSLFKRPGARQLAGALAAVITLAAMSGPALAATAPSQDPFYSQPNPMPSVAPGTVLASRSVTIALPAAATAWQLKYTTTDHKGKPVVAVATLIVPQNPALTPGARPLLAYNFAIDSNYIDCNPSNVLQGNLTNSNGSTNYGSAAEEVLVTSALTAGWAVVVPDYEGLTMNWTVGAMAGHAVLDSIRAAKKFTQAGLAYSPVGMWGYSGGAQATMWAAELAPTYAPEIVFKGIAAGGVPVDLMTIAHKVDGTWMAGIELGAIVGQIDAWPEYNLKSILNAKGLQMYNDVHGGCIGQYITNYSMAKLQDYSGVTDPLSLPAAKAVTDASRLGQHRPAGPLYIYQGIWDEAIPYQDVTNLVNQYCSQGVPVTFNLDQLEYLNEHFSYSAIGASGALAFLQSAFAGYTMPSTCGLPQQPAPPSGFSFTGFNSFSPPGF